MKSKKGFTLIEVIVAITLMGIITLITLPQISRIREQYKLRKFLLYRESLERAAKLYTDTNSKDLFGYNSSGCTLVYYDQLKNANLIKDFPEQDTICSTQDGYGVYETYVAVTKLKTDYMYNVHLKCVKNNVKAYEDNNGFNANTCKNEEDSSAPIVKFKPDGSDWLKSLSSKQIQIIIEDNGLGIGVKQGSVLPKLKYQFVKEGEEPKSGNWISSKYGKTILTINPITINVDKNKYPTQTGQYRIWVDNTTLVDALGNKGSGYTKSKVFKIDNIGPNINITMNKGDNTTCLSTGDVYTSGTWKNYACVSVTSNITDSNSGVDNDKSTLNSNKLSSNLLQIRNVGTTKLVYEAFDNVGNKTQKTVVVKLDRTAPVVPTVRMYKWTDAMYTSYKDDNSYRPAETEFNNGTSYNSGTWFKRPVFTRPNSTKEEANDNSSGHDRYEITVTGAADNKADLAVTSRNIIKDGTSYVKYRSCDKAGNCSAYSSAVTIKVDKTAPICETAVYAYNAGAGKYTTKLYDQNDTAAWTRRKVRVKSICSDATSGCEIEDNEKWTTTDLLSETITSTLNEKRYASRDNTKVTVKDKAGNSVACKQITVKVDRDAPTCNATKTSSGSSGVSVSYTCSDKGSGVQSGSCPSAEIINSDTSHVIKDAVGNFGQCRVGVTSTTTNSICTKWSNNCNSTCSEYRFCSISCYSSQPGVVGGAGSIPQLIGWSSPNCNQSDLKAKERECRSKGWNDIRFGNQECAEYTSETCCIQWSSGGTTYN